MPRGLADVPDLRLEVLQNFVEKFTTPPELIMQNLFPSSNSPSSTVKWESFTGTRGMTPFKPPGAVTPQTYPMGVASNSAEAAFWGEKMYFGEEFLNNLRKEGTESQYLDSQARLARELTRLTLREMRRKEWMFAKMLTAGSFEYTEAGGSKISVDYDIPSSHQVTLATDDKWDAGTSRDILDDIIDGKQLISDDCSGVVDYAMCNSHVLKYVAADPTIQTLLQKSAYGQGDLFSGNKNKIVGVNPKVLGSLLDIPNLVVYDEKYEVRANLTANVTASSTTSITLDTTVDLEVGDTLTFVNASTGATESETISAVTTESNTVTISSAPSISFRAGRDYVFTRKYFIPSTMFLMMSSRVEGMPVAEYKQAPFGLTRTYGRKVDRKEEWDPEGVFIRIQGKGLPILFQRDSVYQLTVA